MPLSRGWAYFTCNVQSLESAVRTTCSGLEGDGRRERERDRERDMVRVKQVAKINRSWGVRLDRVLGKFNQCIQVAWPELHTQLSWLCLRARRTFNKLPGPGGQIAKGGQVGSGTITLAQITYTHLETLIRCVGQNACSQNVQIAFSYPGYLQWNQKKGTPNAVSASA